MKWFLRLSALLVTIYGLFVAYRIGLSHGRNEADGVALAMEAAGRRNAAKEASKIIGHPDLWEEMTLENFRNFMSHMESGAFYDLQRSFHALPHSQQQRVIYHLFGDLTEEEERELWSGRHQPRKYKAQQAAP